MEPAWEVLKDVLGREGTFETYLDPQPLKPILLSKAGGDVPFFMFHSPAAEALGLLAKCSGPGLGGLGAEAAPKALERASAMYMGVAQKHGNPWHLDKFTEDDLRKFIALHL